MADNYCQSSSFIEIPVEKDSRAWVIVERIGEELEADEDEGYAGYSVAPQPGGIWLHNDESINPDHAEKLVKALYEELNLPGVFVCSWAYTCSKQRVGEFGGGAFAVQKGHDTIWIDAAHEAASQAERMRAGK